MSGDPPYSLADFVDEASVDPSVVADEQAARIDEALARIDPELYGEGDDGDGGDGDDGGDVGPPTLGGSIQEGTLDEFGSSIAAAGDTAVVGAPGSDLGDGDDEGVALVFERDGGTFQQVATLTASEPGDRVGENVDVDGNTAVVGAPGTTDAAGNQVGEIYVYGKRGGTWDETPEIALSDADNLQDEGPDDSQPPELNPQPSTPAFGSILAVEDDTIVAIGQPADFDIPGLLQFRPRETGDPIPDDGQGSSWVFIDQFVDLLLPTDVATDGGLSILTNDDPDRQNARVFPVGVNPSFERFGPDTDIPGFGAVGDIANPSGSTPRAFVGATDQVLVYEATSTGGLAPDFPDTATATLTPSTGVTGVGFGTSSLAADGTTAVVGAPAESTTDGTGAVYRFERSGGGWSQVDRITAPAGVTDFGTTLNLGTNTVYVGDGSDVYTYPR